MTAIDRFRLDGRVAWITGGARGLGRAIAEALATAGASVALSARAIQAAEAAARELAAATGARSLGLAADVTRALDVEAAVAKVLDHYGRLDILVNNAGINIRRPIEQLEESEW